jgi:secreted trypsin-like serine protease
MASYGFDEVLGGRSAQRLWIRYRITASPDSSGKVQYEQPGRALYKGDSGGPCFRTRLGPAELVGISSRALGEEPTFTSIHDYRGWLRAEAQRAARDDSRQPHDSP